MNNKQLLELEKLEKVNGGDGFDDFFNGLNNIGEAITLVNEMFNANMCPFCNKQVNPDKKKSCTPQEAMDHLTQKHQDVLEKKWGKK